MKGRVALVVLLLLASPVTAAPTCREALDLVQSARSALEAASRGDPELLANSARASTAIEAALNDAPGDSLAVEAGVALGRLLMTEARYRTDHLDGEGASDALDRSERALRTAAQEAERRLRSAPTEERARLDWFQRQAHFYSASLERSRALLEPEGSDARRARLQRAVTAFNDFIWENEENILGGYAALHLAQSLADLGDVADAIELYASATTYSLPDPKANPEEYGKWSDLALQAFYKMAELARTKDDPILRERVADRFRALEERLPDALTRRWGRMAIAELARLYLAMGNPTSAARMAEKVLGAAKDARDDAAAFLARRVLAEIAVLKGVELRDPALLLEAAEARARERKFEEAIELLAKALEAAPEEGGVRIRILMKTGELRYRLDQYYPAISAYEKVIALAGGKPPAGDAAYYRYRAAVAQHQLTRSAEDRAMKVRFRAEFAERFPDHPRAIDLMYYIAADEISEADGLRYRGKKEEAGALYEKALAGLGKVRREAVVHPKAWARRGEVLHKLGRFEEVLVELAPDGAPDPGTKPESRANARQGAAIASYYRALALTSLSRWPGALEELADYERKHTDEIVRGFLAPVRYERVRALVALGRQIEAEREARALQEGFPGSERVGRALYLVANSLAKLAAEAREDHDEVAWEARLRKAATLFAEMLEGARVAEAEDWRTLSGWWVALGEAKRARKCLDAALAAIDAKLHSLPPNHSARPAALEERAKILLEQGKLRGR